MVEKLIPRRDDAKQEPLEKDNGSKSARNLMTLHSLLNPRTTKLISRKIFNDNEYEFRQFIQNLDSYQSWQESLKLIEQELNKRRIKENDQSAVLLTNIVYRRYFPHDEGVKIE